MILLAAMIGSIVLALSTSEKVTIADTLA